LTAVQEEEDEVYSVARLLGDLVAYRASGTGHMELLAGFFKFHSLNPHCILPFHQFQLFLIQL